MKIRSLGGCVTHDICQKAAGFDIAHVDHLWRRPTIALMSRPARRMPFLDNEFPAELIRYWQDDFRKAHLSELCASDEDVLVFDLTRDVVCSLYEVEDLCFVVDPMSLKTILWDSDRLCADTIRSKVERHQRLIHYADPCYFEIWQAYFDDFAAMARRFGTVVLNRLYYTNKIASEGVLTHGDPAAVAAANGFLDQVYDYVSSSYDFIRILSIPREMMVTGPAVPWGGPTYAHVQNEATALFADRLRGMLLGDAAGSGKVLTQCAIDRMNRHEDLLRTHHHMYLERNELAAQLEMLTASGRTQLDQAQQRIDALIAERDALRRQLDELESRSHIAAAGRDREHNLAAE